MRFSARSKVGILLSLVTILTLISAFAVTTFMGGRGTQAAHSTHSVTYHGHRVSATKQKLHVTKAVKHSVSKHTAKKFYAVGSHSVGKKSSAKLNAARQQAPRLSAANASAVLSPRVHEGGILSNFAGLTAEQSAFLEGVLVLPPDMALCAGHDASIAGNPKVEFQVINLAIAEFDTAGNVLTGGDLLPFGVDSMSNFFQEPGVPFFGGELVSDPNCIYDAASDTFFFEAIATDLFNGATESHADLVVYSPATGDATEYQFDTTDLGNTDCPCLGDQGKLGVDNHAVYISMDEFPFFANHQNGAELLAINKTDLVNQFAVAEASFFNNIAASNGVPITSLQPAVSISPSNTEYLVNSFPYTDEFQNINPTSKALGFWTVTNDEDIPNSDVTLTGIEIASERYAFNIPAVTTGFDNGVGFTPTLNAGDDRMMQAEFIGGNVWAALDSSVNIAGDPTTRDGVAWFKIGVHSQTVRQQGFIGSPKNNLLYPSINVTTEGTVGIGFSLTGPNLNPTAAYVVRKAGATSFGSIVRAFTGLNPSLDGSIRWGDYSRAALDINGKDVWFATEISEPPDDFESFFGLNDATRIWEVKGDH
jgi:hypothetical protein